MILNAIILNYIKKREKKGFSVGKEKSFTVSTIDLTTAMTTVEGRMEWWDWSCGWLHLKLWGRRKHEWGMQLCNFRNFDTFGNIAHTYAVHGDGAAFNVETHDNGGGVNQNICNLGVMRDRRPVKAEEQVIDDWSIPAWTERKKEISHHGDVRVMT